MDTCSKSHGERRVSTRRTRRSRVSRALLLAVISFATTEISLAEEASCPLRPLMTCHSKGSEQFQGSWRNQTKCWLCPAASKVAHKSSIVVLEDFVMGYPQLIIPEGPMPATFWTSPCLWVYLLALVSYSRSQSLPTELDLYTPGLRILASCRFDEHKFFKKFGISLYEITYLFGLIAELYNTTHVEPIATLQHRELAWGKTSMIQKSLGVNKRPLVIDVGLGLGADTRYYLRQGFRVLSVEANQESIDHLVAMPSVQPYLLSGQLTVLNAAIASPDSSEVTTKFWVVPFRPEHSQADPSLADLSEAAENIVQTVRCADLLRVYGQALYMKIDVETSTLYCLASLAKEVGSLGSHWTPPKYISLEVENVGLIGETYKQLLKLGYTHYKVARQYIYVPGPCERGAYQPQIAGSGSGPFGEAATDYQVGTRWKALRMLLNDTQFREDFIGNKDAPIRQ